MLASVKYMNLKPSTWEKLTRNYIPNELIPSNWSCSSRYPLDSLENLLSKGHQALRMYESPEQLAVEVLNFNQYPGCFKEIGVDTEDRFKNGVQIYKSLKRNEYIYKIDFCTAIYRILNRSLDDSKWKLINDSVILYLKNLESTMTNNWEMIEYPREKLAEVKEAVWRSIDASKYNEFIEKTELIKDSDDVIQKWKSILNKNGNLESEQEILDVLNESFRHFPVKGNEKRYTKMYELLRVIISRIFYIEVGSILPNNTESTPIVRLFCEDKEYVVMAEELLETMKREEMNVSKIKNLSSHQLALQCFMFNELANVVDKEDLKRFEFVNITVQVSRFAATPIPTIYGGYCIPLFDAINQLQHDMVQYKRVFQMATPEELPIFKGIFVSLQKSSFGFFVDLNIVDETKRRWNYIFKNLFKNKPTEFQPKDVRKVNERRGFTVEDLKNELEYLNLTRVFPEIKEYAEGIYSRFGENRKMKTTQMLIAVHGCQVECFGERYRKIHHPDENSELISPGTSGTTSQSNGSSVQATSNATQSSPESTVASSVSESSSESTEEIPKTSDSSIESTREKTKEEKKKLKKMKRKEKMATEKQEEKPEETRNSESKTCPKCFRSSEFSRKTNEKLRISKIECKSLKKKLDEKTRKEEENEQLIRELKEKLEEKEKKCEELMGEKEEIEKKLEEKQVIIDVLETEKEMNRMEIMELRKEIQRNFSYSISSNSVLSEESKNALFDLLAIRNTMKTENALKKCEEITRNLSKNSNDETVQRMTRCEFVQFEKFCKIYEKSINHHIEYLRIHSKIRSNWTPNLPDFPRFSQCFLIEYKKTMKKECPIICESLLKNQEELEDLE
uniref:RING-type domain-containing protein n=1 Tax=Caenorhabditis tropicalis TaxID=1561998 RepID=A0A1I7V1G2_9PELO